MAGLKRPAKVKLLVVKPPATVFFSEALGRTDSIYVQKITEALNTRSAIVVLREDKYLQSQFKMAAKKIGVKLVFGVDGDDLYIKPLEQSSQVKRLMLLLREPRTMNELMAAKLELHLQNTLSKLAADGLAHIHKEKWVLTSKGLEAI